MSENSENNPGTQPGNSPQSHATGQNWERDLLADIAQASLNEQKLNRRWNIFFRAVYLMMFLFLLIVMYLIASISWQLTQPLVGGGKKGDRKGHTALINIEGAIGPDKAANADNVVGGLRAAVKNKYTRGVILRVNSPGGSPVESAYIYDEIMRLKKLHPKIKFYTVVKEYCFSGCYYIASATDFIYANRQSMVGSIGVIHMSFGLPGLLKKMGIKPRIITSGKNKAFLNMFDELKPEHREHMIKILKQTHQIFIDDVKKGRGKRLTGKDDEVFTGLLWNARTGQKLGLVDHFGSSSYVAREVIKAKKIVDFTPKRGWFKGFFSDMKNNLKQKLYISPHGRVMAY